VSLAELKEERLLGLPVSREAEVLLCAASVRPAAERIDRLRALLTQDLDWDWLREAAAHHCIESMLYWHLSRAGLDAVPENATAALKQSYARVVQCNMLFVQELLHLVKLLSDASIPVVPYKGPLLASVLYEDLAQRQMWDLDLLVKEEDVARAKRILLDDGYTQTADLTPEEEQRVRKQNDEEVFHSPRHGLEIELHWRLMPPAVGKASPSEFVWEHARTETRFGMPMLTLPAELHALVIFLHAGVKHRWAQLKFLADAARLMNLPAGLDWGLIWREMNDRRESHVLLVGACLAQTLLGAPVPEIVAAGFQRDARLRASVGLAIGRLFRDGFGLPGLEEWRGYTRALHGLNIDGQPAWTPLGERLRYARSVLTPEYGDKFLLPGLPQGLSFLHYAVRPVRLFSRNGLRLFGRMR
jgi:hypothetical protein